MLDMKYGDEEPDDFTCCDEFFKREIPFSFGA